jgi:hypothetical protein
MVDADFLLSGYPASRSCSQSTIAEAQRTSTCTIHRTGLAPHIMLQEGACRFDAQQDLPDRFTVSGSRL